MTTGRLSFSKPRQHALEWAAVIGSLVYALLYVRFEWGGVASYVLALLPTVLAYVVSRTWLAGAFVFLLPMYFVIGQVTVEGPHYQPFTALDRAMPLSPPWMLVYGSLYMSGFVLPLVVVRGRRRFEQAMKAYLFVMLVSYAGFLAYPTLAPRVEPVVVTGFATWSLQLFYDLDQPYGCFPSLHVAYAFVGAMACHGMHRGVGLAAVLWAILIGVSTIYTKQHFAVDAVAGAIIGIAAYTLFLRAPSPEPVEASDRRHAPRRALGVAAAYAAAVGIFYLAYLSGPGPR